MRLLFALAGVIFLLVVPQVFGQDVVGSRIFGTVTDPHGGGVPDAVVRITSPDTGFTRVITTAVDGTYVAPQILAGTYEIEVSSPGFRTVKVTSVEVRVNENARQDVRLELGEVATKVEIKAQAAMVNSYTAELAQTINTRQVMELPLNARDVTSLALLVAGATDPVSTSFYASSSGFTATAPSVNGSKIQDNSYLLDGVSNLYSQRLSSNLYPNPDAIEEFTMNTAQYSAEFGGRPGGQLSARTKSGTNTLHGSLFEFVRNGEFNARNWADSRGVNDGIKRNQFGWAGVHPENFRRPEQAVLVQLLSEDPVPHAGESGIPRELDGRRKAGQLLRSFDGQDAAGGVAGLRWLHADGRHGRHLRSADGQFELRLARNAVRRK